MFSSQGQTLGIFRFVSQVVCCDHSALSLRLQQREAAASETAYTVGKRAGCTLQTLEVKHSGCAAKHGCHCYVTFPDLA